MVLEKIHNGSQLAKLQRECGEIEPKQLRSVRSAHCGDRGRTLGSGIALVPAAFPTLSQKQEVHAARQGLDVVGLIKQSVISLI